MEFYSFKRLVKELNEKGLKSTSLPYYDLEYNWNIKSPGMNLGVEDCPDIPNVLIGIPTPDMPEIPKIDDPITITPKDDPVVYRLKEPLDDLCKCIGQSNIWKNAMKRRGLLERKKMPIFVFITIKMNVMLK